MIVRLGLSDWGYIQVKTRFSLSYAFTCLRIILSRFKSDIHHLQFFFFHQKFLTVSTLSICPVKEIQIKSMWRSKRFRNSRSVTVRLSRCVEVLKTACPASAHSQLVRNLVTALFAATSWHHGRGSRTRSSACTLKASAAVLDDGRPVRKVRRYMMRGHKSMSADALDWTPRLTGNTSSPQATVKILLHFRRKSQGFILHKPWINGAFRKDQTTDSPNRTAIAPPAGCKSHQWEQNPSVSQ